MVLSVRTAQTTDRLLGVSFIAWSCNYFVYDIPYLFFYNEEELPPLFSLGSDLFLYLGTVTFAVFTRAVFHNQQRWALWLIVGITGCLFVGVTGSSSVGDWNGELPLSNPWWWFTRVGTAAPLVWMAVDGFIQYVKSRRRQQLGLCTPQVRNRYLLWSLTGAFWVVLELVDVAQYVVYESTGSWSDSLVVLIGFLETIPGGIAWLIFFPPAFYRRWIDGAAPAAEATAIDA
jgi:hypothetical protein